MSAEILYKIRESATMLKSYGVSSVDAAVILGTGLHGLAREIDIECEINYKDLPYFPVSTVEFHQGKLIYGSLSDKKILAFNGRFHSYEGYSMKEIAMPVWLSKIMGASYMLISNAAGNLQPQWKKGDLMLVTDHINLLPSNPLTGKNEETLGPRFPDMSQAYHKKLLDVLRKLAGKQHLTLREGVYVAVSGPNLETPAEYRFLARIGASAVGMSTVPEVIAAVHCGLPVAAVSVLTDDCDPDNLHPVNIQDIIAVAGKAEPCLTKLFKECIKIFSL